MWTAPAAAAAAASGSSRMDPCAFPGRNLSSSGSEQEQKEQQEEMLLSGRGYAVLAAVMGVSSAGGVLLNLLVIAITLRHRQLRQPLNFALVNLAVCDLGSALFGGVPTAITAAAAATGRLHLERTGCTLEGFTMAFFGKRPLGVLQ